MLLVDMDPQANLTSGVGLKGQANSAGTIYQALTSGVEARVYIVQGRFEHVNFIVEPAPVTSSIPVFTLDTVPVSPVHR